MSDPRWESCTRMRQLTSIVALNQHGAIGSGNRLPWRVRSDLQFFRKTTLDQAVIMGRKTYESLNGALPRRKNIVVTHRFSLFQESEEAQSVGSIQEALVAADRISKRKEIFIIGGATMYEQFSSYVDRYLITFVDKDVPDADTFFKESWLGDLESWDQKIISHGRADGIKDEADFYVWEFKSKRAKLFAERRDAQISDYLNRADAKLKTTQRNAVAAHI